MRQTPPMSRIRSILPLLAWLAMLVTVIVGFGALGRGAMAGPELMAPGTWADWAAGRTPTEAVFAVLRIVVQVVASYLLVVTVLAAVASVWRAGRLLGVVDVLTLPFVRGTIHSLVGVGLVGASVAGVGAGWSSPTEPVGGEVHLAASVQSPAGATVLHRLPAEAPAEAPVMRLVTDGAGSSPTGAPDAAPAPSSADTATWEIQAGDHLWSVAERVMANAFGRDVSDAEVAPYFHELVAANTDRLADPGNPDLVFPGQQMVLPPPPAVAG